MYDFSRFNKKKNPRWNYDTTDFEYVKTSDVYAKIGNTPFNIHGVFITPDNGYGTGAVIIADKCLINAPSSFVETAQEILADEKAVKEINEHGAKMFIEKYYSKKYRRDGYRINFFNDFVDINPNEFVDITTETSKTKDVPF